MKNTRGFKKDEVIMKGKRFGSNCIYPSVFKDYFLEAINESGYHNRVIYKDIDNLSINLNDVKINMYSVNIFLSSIFRHYKHVKFNVLQVRKIYHVKNYQLYNAKVSITYKGSKWLMNLNVGNTLSKFPSRKIELYTLPSLKRKIELMVYTKEEILADLFYRITNNLNTTAIDLYNSYLIFYDNINISDLGVSLVNLYLSINNQIDCNSINKKINYVSNNKKLKEKWIIFKSINQDISIEYEDIMCSLYLILLKLKERVE